MNLSEALAATAARVPDRTAIIFGQRQISYRDLDEQASGFASFLAGCGISAGDRVALWLPNHPSFISAMYGAWRAGAVVVPVHAMLTPPEASHILADSGASVLACASVLPGDLHASLPKLRHVVVLDEPDGQATSLEDAFSAPAGGSAAAAQPPDELALLAYTSGTSGLPKGAMLTHSNLHSNLEQMKHLPVAIREDDVGLCVLPLFHIFGLNVVVNLAVETGATLVLLERFDPAGSVRAIREHKVTSVAAAPPAYVAWLSLPESEASAVDFASVRVAASGAAPLPVHVLEGFADRLGVTIWEGYGLTETSPTLTSTSVGGVAKAGSIGRPLPGVEIRLVAEDGDDAEEGDPGEVVVRGPNVFRGYWNRPEETAAAFADGWFRTGDVAISDEDGDLYLVDRKRDLILVSGFNVYPKEVEDVLSGHEKVADVAVAGIPHQYHGEQVKAVVTPLPGADPTAEELIAFCRTRLAPYKVPSIVDFTDRIPRNAAGKVLRRTLRA
ncbi:MAG TPA: long-chain fatty acid--CoA ligase [Actinomycetota bacterium]|nr:long-chain fatty acid--CoA ligase [Actinomycetota bacterium]